MAGVDLGMGGMYHGGENCPRMTRMDTNGADMCSAQNFTLRACYLRQDSVRFAFLAAWAAGLVVVLEEQNLGEK